MGCHGNLQTGQETSLESKVFSSLETSTIILKTNVSSDLDQNGNQISNSHWQIGIGRQEESVVGSIEDYHAHLLELQKSGRTLRSDQNQPSLSTKPSWFDENLFNNAKLVYERHFMGVNFAHLSGLLLLVRVDSIYRTLSKTGESDTVAKLFKRYYHTVIRVKEWYEGDIFDERSRAHRALLMVRGMHNKVSSKFNDAHATKANESGSIQSPAHESSNIGCPNSKTNGLMKATGTKTNEEDLGFHISVYDIMITQFAFIGLIVTSGNKVGLIADFSRKDLDSLLHFWRVIGFYMGLSHKFNLCSYDLKDIVGLCNVLTEVEYKKSMAKNLLDSAPGIMSVNITRAVKFIPMITFYGMMRHLSEILQFNTNEIEPRRTRYSNLSYTLINLVMTRLLAYRALRYFNNGLTRLSLYIVGKIESWYTSHLESKFGQELKA